jgi:DNA-binding IclR family transcriptional regulator
VLPLEAGTADDRTNGDERAGTVARAVRILRAIAEADDGRPQSVTELAGRVDLSTSTVHRLLQLLRAEGMVETAPRTRRYVVGIELYRLGMLAARRYGFVDVARPIQERLVEVCRETCVLGAYLPQEGNMAFIQQVETQHPLRFAMPMHVSLPLVWGASGLSILAFVEPERAEEIIAAAEPSPVDGAAPPPRDVLDERLDEVRRRGYAHSQGEKLADSVGIAAPVFGQDDEILGCLAVTIPVTRFDASSRDHLGRLVADAADELSASLGASRRASG